MKTLASGPEIFFDILSPKKARIRNPTSGKSGIKGISLNIYTLLQQNFDFLTKFRYMHSGNTPN